MRGSITTKLLLLEVPLAIALIAIVFISNSLITRVANSCRETYIGVIKEISTEAMKQVGKASEQFSQSLSSERETVRTFTKRSIWISLIPTAVLIIWELIRHIFLLT